jgi:hypothetical protein
VDLREKEWGGVDWIDLAQVNYCEQGNELGGFHKMLGSSCVAAQLAASQEGLSLMKLVSFSFFSMAPQPLWALAAFISVS